MPRKAQLLITIAFTLWLYHKRVCKKGVYICVKACFLDILATVNLKSEMLWEKKDPKSV